MMTMQLLEQKLRRSSRKQAALYLFCNFVSLLLITAYAALMFSPTVLTVLPEGGDSRKQMIMVFVLALVGCVVFTVYASGLFFRQKSRQLGVLMALGASGKRLSPGLFREVLMLSSVSSLLGILAGLPFMWLLWNGFCRLIVDSREMVLILDFKFLYLSALFFVLVVALSCMNAHRYLRRTDIMDVVHEEHKNEPVKEPGIFCGPMGILLVFAGAVAGYEAPAAYMKLFSAYPSFWINVLYAPALAGLYMIMLHTVVHGWLSHRKDPFRNIISRSMMKFQGKQTVNSLLVSTVLIAGSAFAIFYLPMLGMGGLLEMNRRPFDYCYHYRQDQSVPGEKEISDLAAEYGLAIRDYRRVPYISLAMDGYAQVEEGRSFHVEHLDFLTEARFLSETAFEILTGKEIRVEQGAFYPVSNQEETSTFRLNASAGLLTNMVTLDTLPVRFGGYAHYDLLDGRVGYYILNDGDYERICAGLSDDWKGQIAFFNMDGQDSYAFARDFFYTLVGSFGPECEYPTYYDRVEKFNAQSNGEIYWGDTEKMTPVSYDAPDSSTFRLFWTYMPKIRILDKAEFLKTFSVYLMCFLFISIICSLAALIIGYTRCITIVLNNRYVFDSLKRLGASSFFLIRELRHQAGIVLRIPCVVGMSAMYLLYVLLMLGNDGKIAAGEAAGLAVCLLILILMAGLHYLVYRIALRRMKGILGVEGRKARRGKV